MTHYWRRNLKILGLLVAVITGGTVGFYVLEPGWSLFDAFYMVAISISTVGYGEVHQLTPAGRVLAVAVIFGGLGVVTTFAASLASTLLEGQMSGAFRRRKMQKRVDALRGHYVIVGHGRTGQAICVKLDEAGVPFVVVEEAEGAAALAEVRGFLVVRGSAADDETLVAAGIQRAEGVVVSLYDDAATLMITLAARELKPDIYLIARGHDPAIESRIKRAGADRVLYPMRLGGEQIARIVAGRFAREGGADEEDAGAAAVLDYTLRLFRNFDAHPVAVREALERAEGIRAVALKRANGEEVEAPASEVELEHNDTLVVLARVGRRSAGAAAGTDGDPQRRGFGGEAPVSPASSVAARPSRRVADDPFGRTMRDRIRWSERLSVGVSAIDSDHRTLVQIVGRFHDEVEAGKAVDAVADVFLHLIDYTARHFANEEREMAAHGFPELAAHREEHKKLVEQVMDLSRQRHKLLATNVGDFLDAWLLDHIMTWDMRLGQFLRGHGLR